MSVVTTTFLDINTAASATAITCKHLRRTFVASYLVVIEQDGATYGAYLPDVPGCAATSSSLSSVKELIKTGLGLYLTELATHNEPFPEATTTTFSPIAPNQVVIQTTVLHIEMSLDY